MFNTQSFFRTCTIYALATIVGLTGLGPVSAIAADVKYYPPGVNPQPIEVARMLAGPQFKPSLKMRGVKVVGDLPAHSTESLSGQPQPIMLAQASAPTPPVKEAAPATPAAAPQQPVAQSGQIFALSIPFAFNSAKLHPDAFDALDNIAEGIKLVKLNGKLVIEGHTDAQGGDAYNMKLSTRRAAAVKRYFTERHGIAPASLKVIGKGRAEPLNTSNPRAAENRRVQFRLA